MFFVCAEHLEEALDEFVEDYATAPDVHLLSAAQPPVKEEISRCHFCANPPVYLVAPQTP